MEKAIVSFKNPQTNQSIEINLQYDKENSSIDYDVKLSEDYTSNTKLDFIGFLATMFLSSLKADSDTTE